MGIDVVVCSFEYLERNFKTVDDFQTKMKQYQKDMDDGSYGLKQNKKGTEPPKRSAVTLASELFDQDSTRFGLMVIDEVQKINKTDGIRHRAAKRINAHARACLSGTLAHNRWFDIGGAVDFIKGQPFRTTADFKRVGKRSQQAELERSNDELQRQVVELTRALAARDQNGAPVFDTHLQRQLNDPSILNFAPSPPGVDDGSHDVEVVS